MTAAAHRNWLARQLVAFGWARYGRFAIEKWNVETEQSYARFSTHFATGMSINNSATGLPSRSDAIYFLAFAYFYLRARCRWAFVDPLELVIAPGARLIRPERAKRALTLLAAIYPDCGDNTPPHPSIVAGACNTLLSAACDRQRSAFVAPRSVMLADPSWNIVGPDLDGVADRDAGSHDGMCIGQAHAVLDSSDDTTTADDQRRTR